MDSSAGEQRGSWTGFVVPAFVAVLLGIQFFLGFRGFDHPDGGLLGLLEAPGALLGWGGVVILAVLLGWLIAGLVGRDLFGLQGASGLGVRLVGCVALGLALGGAFGLLGGRSAGGEVGAGIGGLLGDSLGAVAGVLLLLLMAIPALVLSISPFFTTGPRAGPPGASVSMDALSELEPKPGLYEGTTSQQPKPLYPERRFDEDGNEIPMSFDARDVGPVHYADEERDPDTLPQRRKPDPVPVPDDTSLPDGVRFADDEMEDAPEGVQRPDPVETGDGRIPLPDGVRYVDEEAEDADAPGQLQDEDVEEEEEEDDDGEAPSIEEETAPPAPRPPTVPNVTPAPHAASPPPTVRGADALGQLQDEDEGARYRAKLEGSGIFDEPAATAPDAAPEEAATAKTARRKPSAKKKKTTTKKKAKAKPAGGKKKATAKASRKKAAPGSRKKATASKSKKKAKAKAPAGKKAAAKKKTAAKKKKATTRTGATGTKAAQKKAAKAAPGRKPAPDPEPPDVGPVGTAPPRKGAGATGPEDEVYRKAVAVAMERSAASSVLLSRRLGIGYAQARALIELLVRDRILGEMTPSGSRPLLITEEEWEERTR